MFRAKRSKGFSSAGLIIVIAIVGILAAVAVPYTQTSLLSSIDSSPYCVTTDHGNFKSDSSNGNTTSCFSSLMMVGSGVFVLW